MKPLMRCKVIGSTLRHLAFSIFEKMCCFCTYVLEKEVAWYKTGNELLYCKPVNSSIKISLGFHKY